MELPYHMQRRVPGEKPQQRYTGAMHFARDQHAGKGLLRMP